MTTEAAATNAQSAFTSETPPEGFTTADRTKRFAEAKSANAPRVMDIDAVYDPDRFHGEDWRARPWGQPAGSVWRCAESWRRTGRRSSPCVVKRAMNCER